MTISPKTFFDCSAIKADRFKAPCTDDIEYAVFAEMGAIATRFGHLSYIDKEGEIVEKMDTKLQFYVGSLERDADFANNILIRARRDFNNAQRAERRQSDGSDADSIDGNAFIIAAENVKRAEDEYNQMEDAAEFAVSVFEDMCGYPYTPFVSKPKEEVVRFTTPAIYAAEQGLDEKTVERQAKREAAKAARPRSRR